MKVLQRWGVETATKRYHRGALVPSNSCLCSARTWCGQRPCPRGARFRAAFVILSGPARTFASASPDGGRGAKARHTRTPNLGGEPAALPFSSSSCAPRSAGAWRRGAEKSSSPRPPAAGFLGSADSISWEARGWEATAGGCLLHALQEALGGPALLEGKKTLEGNTRCPPHPDSASCIAGGRGGAREGRGGGAGSIFYSAQRRAAEFWALDKYYCAQQLFIEYLESVRLGTGRWENSDKFKIFLLPLSYP